MMKRFTSILLAICLCIICIGCGINTTAQTTDPTNIMPSFAQPTDDTTAPDGPDDIGNGGAPETEPDMNATTNPTEAPTVSTEPPAPATEATDPIAEPTEKPTEPETKPTEKPTAHADTYQDVDETVYANTTVNIRSGPGSNYEKLGTLHYGESITRTGIGSGNWDRVEYNGQTAYMYSDYIQKEKPSVANTGNYPMSYSDGSCTITIYREWWDADGDDSKRSDGAWCYAAHVTFSDYTRLGTSCANGSYGCGYETTSGAASRLGAILCVNGPYHSTDLGYTTVRDGVLWEGAGRPNSWCPAVYSKNNGLLLSAWESDGTPGVSGGNFEELVADGTVTDNFSFGPPILSSGSNWCSSDSYGRAQRTFIGTNGNPGDIWIVVSDGRYNDGESAGLNGYQMAEYLISKGCIFGVPLDGGGSSTMVFRGSVLNAARGNQRAVVDFLYFK